MSLTDRYSNILNRQKDLIKLTEQISSMIPANRDWREGYLLGFKDGVNFDETEEEKEDREWVEKRLKEEFGK